MHVDEHFEGKDARKEDCDSNEDLLRGPELRLSDHVKASSSEFGAWHYNIEHSRVVVVDVNEPVFLLILALVMAARGSGRLELEPVATEVKKEAEVEGKRLFGEDRR